MAVEDQLDDDVGAGEGGARQARLAVAHRAHRVEEVGHGPGTGVEAEARLVGGRVGVAERDQDAVGGQAPDDVEGAGQLRRDGHRDHVAALAPAVQLGLVRVAAVLLRVGAEPARREVRALEVHAEAAGRQQVVGAVVRRERLAEAVQRAVGVGRGRGDQGGQERGHAVPGQRACQGAHLLDVGGHQVDPGEAVHLEVDQAGRGDPAARGRRQPDLDDLVAVDADVAGQQVAVDEGGRDPQVGHQ